MESPNDPVAPNHVDTEPAVANVNANGLNEEQQAEYEAYYARKGEYHPDQPIPKDSRHFGIVQEENPFPVSEANDNWRDDMLLGEINLHCEYNNTVPQGTTTSRKEQQKLFHSNPTQNVSLVFNLSKANLIKLKSETGHLLGCNQEDYMKVFLKKVLQGNVIPIIEGTVKRLPVRGEFMLHINKEGRLDLAWMEMSMHKLHRFLDLLIHDIQGSAETAFVSPQKEATDLAIDFAEQLKYMNIGEYAKDAGKLTRVMAEARLHFSESNQRLKMYISDPGNSQVIVFGIFTHLKKSTVTDAERLRNEKIMRLLEIMKIVSP